MNGMDFTAAQQRQLMKTLQHTHDVRQYRRSLAIFECGRGEAVSEVAQSQHVTRQSINNWVIRFHHAGQCAALADR
jgi:transposase